MPVFSLPNFLSVFVFLWRSKPKPVSRQFQRVSTVLPPTLIYCLVTSDQHTPRNHRFSAVSISSSGNPPSRPAPARSPRSSPTSPYPKPFGRCCSRQYLDNFMSCRCLYHCGFPCGHVSCNSFDASGLSSSDDHLVGKESMKPP